MTTQTKKFIEPKDILGLHMECTGCHAALSLPFSKDIDVKSILFCPHCRRSWLRTDEGQSTAEVIVAEAIEQIKRLNRALTFGRYDGFSLTLEIVHEDEDGEPST